jgi:predicted DNA-binding protein
MKKSVFLRLTDKKLERLEVNCEATSRAKSDVLRELIRSLKIKSRPRRTGL